MMKSRLLPALMLTVALGLVQVTLASASFGFADSSSRADIQAEAADLDLAEAIEMLELSALQQVQMPGEAWTARLELRTTFGENWMAVAEAREEHEALLNEISVLSSAIQREIRVASHRILANEGPAGVRQAFDQLSDLGLSILLGQPAVIFASEPEGERLREFVSDSLPLQERLERMLANDHRFMDLVLDSATQDQLVESGEMTREEFIDFTIGQFAFFSALNLLPQERNEALLTDILTGHRFKHLQTPLREAIANGHVGRMIDLAPEWIAAQVAAGQTIWLAHLASAGEISDMVDLSTRLDGLPRAEQLPIIASSRDPALFPLLHEIHGAIILELGCTDCPEQPGNAELQQLLEAAIRMPMSETDSLAWQLLEALPEQHRGRFAELAYYEAINNQLPERRVFMGELLTAFRQLELHTWKLDFWPGDDAQLLQAAIEQRLDGWHQEVRINGFEGANSWMGCSALGMLLFADHRGWFTQWNALIGELAENDLDTRVLMACHHELARLPALTADPQIIQPIIEFYESSEAGPDHYQMLFNTIRQAERLNIEQSRSLVLDLLESSASLDKMAERDRHWLMTGEKLSTP